jgi:hypothetical protein
VLVVLVCQFSLIVFATPASELAIFCAKQMSIIAEGAVPHSQVAFHSGKRNVDRDEQMSQLGRKKVLLVLQ